MTPDQRNGGPAPASWIAASAVSALCGGVLAVWLFPEAIFARNPTGQFRWSLVGIAAAIAVPYAAAQTFLLLQSFRVGGTRRLLWWPVTGECIVAILLPLWWLPGEALLMGPVSAWIPMLPGALLLGTMQWLVLFRIAGMGPAWIARTVLGVAVGSIAGLLCAIIVALMLPAAVLALIPFEAWWALVLAGTIAGFQIGPLRRYPSG